MTGRTGKRGGAHQLKKKKDKEDTRLRIESCGEALFVSVGQFLK